MHATYIDVESNPDLDTFMKINKIGYMNDIVNKNFQPYKLFDTNRTSDLFYPNELNQGYGLAINGLEDYKMFRPD